jgi:MoxR-like ATPase
MPEYVFEDGSSSSRNKDIVSYCKESRENVNFYRVTGPIDHWITAVEKKVWGFSSESDYDSVEEGDVLLLHATNSAVNSELTSKKSGIIGVAVISGKRKKEEAWWWSEHKEGDEWKYVVDLEPMLITGSPGDIDRNRGITEKSINEIEKETFALLENFMEMSRANEICNEINGKDFPAMGSRSGFRDQNGKIDAEAPIKIIEEIQEDLTNVESEDLQVQGVRDFGSGYEDSENIPDEVKEDLEKMVENSKNNRGSFTRLFGVKAYLDVDKDQVTDDELKESVEKNYRQFAPGTKGAYLQNRHKAFQKDDYPSFQQKDDKYQLKSEFLDSRKEIKDYVDSLWRKEASTGYFVISHNDQPDQLVDEYLQAPYTSKSEAYDDRYQPSHDLSKLRVGDKLLHYKSGEFVGFSTVKEEPQVRESEDGEKEYFLEVDIQRFDEPRNLSRVRNLLENEKNQIDDYYVLDSKGGKAEGYLKLITKKGFEHVIEGGSSQVNIEKDIEVSLKEDILEDRGLYYPDGQGESIVSQIESALNSGKHIIFTGPPGTGKTEIAEAVAEELEGTDFFTGHQLTTATADWSTFDTVGGFMPEKDGNGDLEFNSGQILKRFKDDERPLKNELLVVDEINRSDIDKAFGQLFTVLSGQKVQLPYTADNGEEIEVIPGKHDDASERPEENQYVVPESWKILATMNSYDKTSLYEMSYAFMRRFAFIRVDAPDENLEEEMQKYNELWSKDVDQDEIEVVADIWERTNNAVEGRKIGPAIAEDMLGFVAANGRDLDDRATDAVINYVFPQLEGVRKNGEIVKKISKADNIDESRLRAVARDMLQVKFNEEN